MAAVAASPAGPAQADLACKLSASAMEEGRFLASRALSTESESDLSLPNLPPQVEVVVHCDGGLVPEAKEAPAAGSNQHRSLLWFPRPRKAQVRVKCSFPCCCCSLGKLLVSAQA